MKKFIRCFSALVLSTCAGFVSHGKGVDANTAKTIGCNYLISQNVPGVSKPSDLTASYMATSMVNGKMVVDYYVFNITGGNTGFVMVSGDDNVTPILAYSSEASFDISRIAPAAKYWIDGYKEQINEVIANDVQARTETIEKWNDLKDAKPSQKVAARTTAVSALLTTKWDQAPYYNSLCPTSTYTGCVATSMAQVMKFWNWPTVGCGFHQYTPTGYSLQSANFGNTTYQWASMPNTVSASNVAVATLMKHAGVAVDMQYGTSESGAYTLKDASPVLHCAEYALETYFHYKRSLRGVKRDGTSSYPAYSTSSWVSMLQAELNAGRPFLYSGHGTSGGHAWVCDGWSPVNMFHMNWGWSGAGPDGNYNVDDLNPPVLGAGGGGGAFNASQGVIIGIAPDSFVTTPAGNIKMLSHLNFTNNLPLAYHGALSISAKILNSNTSTFSGDFCAQVYDTLNHAVGILEVMATGKTINAGDSTTSLTFSTAGLYAMIPSIYYVQIMYRPTGTSKWTPVASNGAFINYNQFEVNNDRLDMALVSAISMAPGTHITPGSAISINARVGNVTGYPSTTNPPVTFNGSLTAVLINCANGTTTTIQTIPSVSLMSGYYYDGTFAMSSAPTAVGTYALAIEHRVGTSGAFTVSGSNVYQNPIIVKIGSAVGMEEPAAPADNVYVFPNPAKDVINIITDGVNVSNIIISDVQGREVKRLNAGNSHFVTVPVSDFAAGIYLVQLQTEQELITKKIVITK